MCYPHIKQDKKAESRIDLSPLLASKGRACCEQHKRLFYLLGRSSRYQQICNVLRLHASPSERKFHIAHVGNPRQPRNLRPGQPLDSASSGRRRPSSWWTFQQLFVDSVLPEPSAKIIWGDCEIYWRQKTDMCSTPVSCTTWIWNPTFPFSWLVDLK